MSLNSTVSAERTHIAFFGMRNAGKSSLVNAVTNQELCVVSDTPGTTTDPVTKAMELLPLGPVVIIDTPGIDDEGALGELRIKKTKEVLSKTDIAVLVVDARFNLREADKELLAVFKERNIPYITVFNKADLVESIPKAESNSIYVSALKKENIDELREKLATISTESKKEARYIVSDLISSGDVVVLVIPIDESAPKGRLILPQQQTMRDILDKGASVVACRDSELESTLNALKVKPKLVITDSQAFAQVSKIVPSDISLTSFSILFARYKGELETLVKGAAALDNLKDNDKILISEGCTHHRQCNDIGTVKMPSWIKNYTGKNLEFSFTSGTQFPDNLSEFALVVHCGACMLNEREMHDRLRRIANADIPCVNYGIAIAHMNCILKRSLEPFPNISSLI